MQPRGFFITFEGSEGCGKSTQIRLLAGRLQKLERRLVLTREPGGTPVGEEIKHLLQFSKVGQAMTPATELLLFTASRSQLVREVIAPAIREGAIVLADRFLDSTTVYQGVARRLDPDSVKTINDFAVNGCLPDLTFLLDLEPRVARERMLSRPHTNDRMEQQSMDFYEAVRAGYLALAQRGDPRICLIDGAKTQAEIAEKIWNTLLPRLEKPAV